MKTKKEYEKSIDEYYNFRGEDMHVALLKVESHKELDRF